MSNKSPERAIAEALIEMYTPDGNSIQESQKEELTDYHKDHLKGIGQNRFMQTYHALQSLHHTTSMIDLHHKYMNDDDHHYNPTKADHIVSRMSDEDKRMHDHHTQRMNFHNEESNKRYHQPEAIGAAKDSGVPEHHINNTLTLASELASTAAQHIGNTDNPGMAKRFYEMMGEEVLNESFFGRFGDYLKAGKRNKELKQKEQGAWDSYQSLRKRRIKGDLSKASGDASDDVSWGPFELPREKKALKRVSTVERQRRRMERIRRGEKPFGGTPASVDKFSSGNPTPSDLIQTHRQKHLFTVKEENEKTSEDHQKDYHRRLGQAAFAMQTHAAMFERHEGHHANLTGDMQVNAAPHDVDAQLNHHEERMIHHEKQMHKYNSVLDKMKGNRKNWTPAEKTVLHISKELVDTVHGVHREKEPDPGMSQRFLKIMGEEKVVPPHDCATDDKSWKRYKRKNSKKGGRKK